MKELHELLKIMSILRDPINGCPWDLEQNYLSILPFTIEEVYELAEAIQIDDKDGMREELGDLLFQIVFYCQLSSEEGGFVFSDIVENINTKLRNRHPHVFGDKNIKNTQEQLLSWERIKTLEKKDDSKSDAGFLDGISSAMPALIHSLKLQKKAAMVGFDWEETEPVLDKIEEEILEVRNEVERGVDKKKLMEEVGDLLFACVNFSRHINIDPEMALIHANHKFVSRFSYIESQLKKKGKTLEEASLKEMEVFWDDAKKIEKEDVE